MKGAERFSWSPSLQVMGPERCLRAGPGPEEHDFHAQGVHKLDSAMSVLTTLLVDLEHELRDHGNGTQGGAEAQETRSVAPAPGPAKSRPAGGGGAHGGDG